MSQRPSGYLRKPDESYATIRWPVLALLTVLRPPPGVTWDPCDRMEGQLVRALQTAGLENAVGTSGDFFSTTPPPGTQSIITNPPYGPKRKGELAVAFIERAVFELKMSCVAMLLRNDFDSAITRESLFRKCPYFAGKVTLLSRIKWFDGSSSPSDNHAWFIWCTERNGSPTISYVARRDVEGGK
jgi:hypothetical protein